MNEHDPNRPLEHPPTQPPPGERKIGGLMAFGCVFLILALALGFGTAVGGSFWSLAIMGGAIVIVGVAVVILLIRRDRRAGPR